MIDFTQGLDGMEPYDSGTGSAGITSHSPEQVKKREAEDFHSVSVRTWLCTSNYHVMYLLKKFSLGRAGTLLTFDKS